MTLNVRKTCDGFRYSFDGLPEEKKEELKELLRKIEEPKLASKKKQELLSLFKKKYSSYRRDNCLEAGKTPRVPPAKRTDSIAPESSKEAETLGEILSRGLERLNSFIEE